jgi:hypothetical protein
VDATTAHGNRDSPGTLLARWILDYYSKTCSQRKPASIVFQTHLCLTQLLLDNDAELHIQIQRVYDTNQNSEIYVQIFSFLPSFQIMAFWVVRCVVIWWDTSMFRVILRNAGILPHHLMASQPRIFTAVKATDFASSFFSDFLPFPSSGLCFLIFQWV